MTIKPTEDDFLNKFKEVKKQRNNHLMDEPDFDIAVQELVNAYTTNKIIEELEELQEQHETGVFYSKIIPERMAELRKTL